MRALIHIDYSRGEVTYTVYNDEGKMVKEGKCRTKLLVLNRPGALLRVNSISGIAMISVESAEIECKESRTVID